MSILEYIVSIFAPYSCLGCGEEGSILCQDCVQSQSMHPEICYKCHALSTNFKTCASCRRYAPLNSVKIAGQYEGALQSAIYALKFGRSSAAAKPLAVLMKEYIPEGHYDFVVPVPTASSRHRNRGYNHSELISRELASGIRSPTLLALGRYGQKRQVGAGRKQRISQMEDSFYLVSRNLKNKKILLLDDVMTTGATLAEAAKTLKKGRPRLIDAIVLARHN